MMKLWMSISAICMVLAQMDNVPQPTELIVRLVYLDSGKPAGNQQIVLYEGSPSRASTIRFKQLTGSDGIAKFRISVPHPENVWVDDNNGRIRGCAWEGQIAVQEIVSNGVTIGKDNRFGQSCKGSEDTIAHLGAKPGEVVIFVRKVRNWDNLLRY